MGRPSVRARLVPLHLVEGPFGGFTAEDQNLAIDHGGGNAAARRRQRCQRFPGIRRGIVGFVGVQIARVAAVDAAADDIQFSVYGRRGQMIPGRGQGHGAGPGIGFRIVDLMGRRIAPSGPRSANGVNAAIEDRRGECAPRGRQRGKPPPSIGCRIVFEYRVDRVPAAAVAPNKIELAVERHRAGVVQPLRHRCAKRPAIGSRIVDLQILAAAEAAGDIDAITDSGNGDLRTRRQHRASPGPLRQCRH